MLQNKIKNEKGSLFVEASIVFPTMFLVIIFLFFVGNAYFQKCRLEKIAIECASKGSSYVADPMLQSVEQGSIPSYGSASNYTYPYRYIFPGQMNSVVSTISSDLNTSLGNVDTGFFSGMKPAVSVKLVDCKNRFVYQKFSVDLSYDVTVPVRLLGDQSFSKVQYSSHVEVPVSDNPEFIRNVNMIEDYVERFTGGDFEEPLNKLINKASEWARRDS